MSDNRLALIREFLDHYSDTFFYRPGMLGPPEVINATSYFYDSVDFVLKYGSNIDSGKRLTWMAFLETKGYFKGARDLLDKRLRRVKREDAYKLLRELRKEYYVWQVSKIEGGKNLS